MDKIAEYVVDMVHIEAVVVMVVVIEVVDKLEQEQADQEHQHVERLYLKSFDYLCFHMDWLKIMTDLSSFYQPHDTQFSLASFSELKKEPPLHQIQAYQQQDFFPLQSLLMFSLDYFISHIPLVSHIIAQHESLQLSPVCYFIYSDFFVIAY